MFGPSGAGAYRGQHGFDRFSNLQPMLVRKSRPDPSVAYPPYITWKSWLLPRQL